MVKKIFKNVSKMIKDTIAYVAPKNHSQFFFISLLVVTLTSALIFLPLFGVNALFIKNLLLPIFSGLLLIILALQFLKNGSFTLIDKKTSWGILLFLLIMLVSGLFAAAPRNSLFGSLGEAPSFSLLFSLTIIFFIASIAIKKFSHVLGLLVTVGTIFSVAFLHIFLRLIFGSSFLSFGFFNTFTSSLIGSWTDFGIVSLLLLVLSVICLEMGKFVKFAKLITLKLAILSIIGLFLVNIGWLWFLVGGFLIIISIYMFSIAYWDTEKLSYERSRAIPWYSLGAFIIVIIGMLFGSVFLGFLGKYRTLNYQEIYPNISATTKAGWVDITQRPLTGIGLSNFDTLWNKIKPVQLSGTSSGSVEFTSGYSFVATIVTTTGVLGIIAVIILIVLILSRYYRVYQKGFSDISERFTTTIVLAGSLVLSFVVMLDYPGVIVLILWTLFMGALWGMFSQTEEYSISFIHDPRTSFFGMMVVLLLVFVGGSFIYINIRKTASVVQYSQALQQLTNNDQNKAIVHFVRANQLWGMDFYNRSLANQVLAQVRNLQVNQNTSKEILSQEVQRILSIGLSYADTATKMDPKNYRNWITLGNVYQFFSTLKIEGSFEKARDAYTTAKTLSPNDTTLDLLFADLDVSAGNTQSATKTIKDSISKYPTASAFTWLYQQDILDKQYDQAETNLASAVQLDPNNSQLLSELGTLLYARAKYQSAITVFERSLTLNRLQPNIFAALGVAYESVGKTDQATQIFDFLNKQLPDTAQKFIDQARAQKGIVSVPQVSEPIVTTPVSNTAPVVNQ